MLQATGGKVTLSRPAIAWQFLGTKMPKMNKKTGRLNQFRHQLGPQVSNQNSLSQYEAAFRRWLGRELAEGRLSIAQAVERFKVPKGTISLIKKQFAPQVVLLDGMTEAEKHKLEELQKRIKQLEKQLEDATVKNIALETLVDVAEKQFNIPIRKKPGAKQWACLQNYIQPLELVGSVQCLAKQDKPGIMQPSTGLSRIWLII